jgi:hypothetical protein
MLIILIVIILSGVVLKVAMPSVVILIMIFQNAFMLSVAL